jgi:hypothetical protein
VPLKLPALLVPLPLLPLLRPDLKFKNIYIQIL